MRIADCLWQDMTISPIRNGTVTAFQSDGCIRVAVLVGGVDLCLHERDMAVATIYLYYLCILSLGRLIKKVGRDVMDRDFVYIYSPIFNYLWGLCYCA